MRTEGRPEQVRAPAREPLTSEGDFVVAVDLAFNFERKLEGGRGLYPMRVSSSLFGPPPHGRPRSPAVIILSLGVPGCRPARPTVDHRTCSSGGRERSRSGSVGVAHSKAARA